MVVMYAFYIHFDIADYEYVSNLFPKKHLFK